jgi:TatD DNase family protein
MTALYDAHNHLQDAWLLSHRDQVISDLVKVGVKAAVVNGTSENDWADVSALCATMSDDCSSNSPHALRLLPSFGLHPWDVGNRSADWETTLRKYVDGNPRALVGEIGLDRWILERARPDDARLAGLRRAPIDEQLAVFRAQLQLAAELSRPASIHCLDAFGLLLETLQTTPLPTCGFLLHAYSGPAEMVPLFARLGAYFSFNGSFLDPRKVRLRPTYLAIPTDRLLVETDAPAMRLPSGSVRFALPPTAGGETINHPANIVVAYEGLAQWRNVAFESLTSSVQENFARLFGDGAAT